MSETRTIEISVKRLIAAAVLVLVGLLVIAFVTSDTCLQLLQCEAAEPDEVYVWEWVEEDIQFRDPGQYGMSVQGAILHPPTSSSPAELIHTIRARGRDEEY